MKYKVGDKVRIKSIDWYIDNKDEYDVVDCGAYNFPYGMSKFCGKIVTIQNCYTNDCYTIKDDDKNYIFTEDMIEGLVEEETLIKLTGEAIKNNEMVVSIDKWILPKGYIFKDENGNVINATKIVLEKKKKEYPTTYEECCEVLSLTPCYNVAYNYYRGEKLNALYHLLICRDAYWKIAGEQMGLEKPWEPNWKAYDKKYAIGMHEDMIYQDTETRNNKILVFPTAEMRDTFYENFKELIEECKELL